MVSGITPCARECKWIVYFGETPKGQGHDVAVTPGRVSSATTNPTRGLQGSAWKLWPEWQKRWTWEAGGAQAHAANTIPPNPANRQDGRLTWRRSPQACSKRFLKDEWARVRRRRGSPCSGKTEVSPCLRSRGTRVPRRSVQYVARPPRDQRPHPT
jgi:hypothetical protein